MPRAGCCLSAAVRKDAAGVLLLPHRQRPARHVHHVRPAVGSSVAVRKDAAALRLRPPLFLAPLVLGNSLRSPAPLPARAPQLPGCWVQRRCPQGRRCPPPSTAASPSAAGLGQQPPVACAAARKGAAAPRLTRRRFYSDAGSSPRPRRRAFAPPPCAARILAESLVRTCSGSPDIRPRH